MTDPLDTVADGGLNSSDTQDWNPKRDGVRVPWYLTTGALILAGGVIFLIIVIAFKVNGMFQPKPAVVAGAASPAAAVSAPAVDKDAEIAALRNQIALLQGQVGNPATAAAPAYNADPAALAQLSARLDRVEANQRALARAAAVANAAEVLQQTARSGAPFGAQLAALEAGLSDPGIVAPLHAYADKGVPTAVDLAVRFPRAARDANVASRNDNGDNSLLGKAMNALGSIISIRRTDNTDGQGTQAVLANAQRQLNAGDLGGAVGSLDTLKPAAHKAIEPWLADARARLLVDDTTSRIAAGALSRMAQTASPADAAAPGAAL